MPAFSFNIEFISAIGNLKKKTEIVEKFEEAEFPPVLSRTIEIKDVSSLEVVAQSHVEDDLPLGSLDLVPAWQQRFPFSGPFDSWWKCFECFKIKCTN